MIAPENVGRERARILELDRLKREKLFRLYRREPEAYARDVLGVVWWGKQVELARRIAKAKAKDPGQPHKIAARASHAVGKSFLAGGLVNWHFDCWNPGITITTAPTQRQVVNVLWKEVRRQRKGRPGLFPKAPRMQTSEVHFAEGFTAADADSFQGLHDAEGLVDIDEAVGVEGQFFDAIEGISSGGNWVVVAQYNPTDASSRMYAEELTGDWDIVPISALEHPNIIAGLDGRPEPYPGAVSLDWVLARLARWCEPVGGKQFAKSGDFEFPPGSGNWYRPGPLFESRVLGRWPSLSFDTLWSEVEFDKCLDPRPIPDEPLVIGCDVARFGDDYTAIHVRRGYCSLWHERHNGWSTSQTAGRLKELAKTLAAPGEDPESVRIIVDDDGVGGGVVDQADGFRFIGVSAGSTAINSEDYPNRRSELWFDTHDRATEGVLDFSRIDGDSMRLIRRQLLTVKWKLNGGGQRLVEPKAEMKLRLKKSNPNLEGGSPDDADAVNLAYTGVGKVFRTESSGYVPPTAVGSGIASTYQSEHFGGYRPEV